MQNIHLNIISTVFCV